MPPYANEALAPLVIELVDASSKCMEQMSPISRDPIWMELINKASLLKFRWMWSGGREGG
jgi:hypothetical protein